jgi:hypothetical protein
MLPKKIVGKRESMVAVFPDPFSPLNTIDWVLASKV